jgi:thiol:disulfide interchange protein DsbA
MESQPMKSILRALLLLALACTPPAIAAEIPVAGRDYVEVQAGRWSPADGRIEVVEVFGYTCPHCAHFEPQLRQWKKKQPGDVNLVTVPAAFGGQWDAWARVYFAAEQLGAVARLHPELFQALHVQGSLPRNATASELAAFVTPRGVDGERFRAALASPETEAQLRRAAGYVRAVGLRGTPTLLVNGKWRVQGETFDDMLRITQWLVAREREAASTAPTSP